MGLPLPLLADYHAFMCRCDGGQGEENGQILPPGPRATWRRCMARISCSAAWVANARALLPTVGRCACRLMFVCVCRGGGTPAWACVNFGDLDPARVRVMAPMFAEGMALRARGLRRD